MRQPMSEQYTLRTRTRPAPPVLPDVPVPDPDEHVLMPGYNITCGECMKLHGKTRVVGHAQRLKDGQYKTFLYIAGDPKKATSFKALGIVKTSESAQADVMRGHKCDALQPVARRRTRAP